MARQYSKNKYGVAPKAERTYNGIVFASKAEMNRYKQLLLIEKSGAIQDLELQPEYLLQDKYTHMLTQRKYSAIKYKGDFRYKENGHVVVEDVKGHITKEYAIKKKILLKLYPDIDFREIAV